MRSLQKIPLTMRDAMSDMPFVNADKVALL